MPNLKQPIKRKWWKESSVYQIYPASFKDSNSDGLGDLPGVISKLDYIKDLGVDIVWLSPILQSPQVDMGYDISDYKQIYPPYGTMADNDALIKGLHDRGMKCVMDLVVNHTSDEHTWFQQSRSSKDNPYRDWYYWRPARYDEQGNRIPPNNWESAFSGSAWEWDETTQEYYLHIFAVQQPDLNWENPKVVEAVHDIIKFWLDRGIDGFRMDVINFISKTFGLPDAEVTKPGFLQSGIAHFSCGPRLHEFLQGIGKILQEYDAFSVGEMPGVNDTSEIIKSVGDDRDELAMIFHFELMGVGRDPQSKWAPRHFGAIDVKKIINKWQEFMLANGGWNALYVENHDQPRSITRFANESPAYRTISSKMLAANLGFQSGTVYVYQGQELAMINVPPEWGLDKYKDIEIKNRWAEVKKEHADDKEKLDTFKEQYRLIGRDNARTPVQWSAEPHAGFMPKDAPDGVVPWMDIHPDYEKWNAENSVNDPKSSYHYWKKVLQLRKEHRDIFVYGDFDMLDMENKNVITYVRSVYPDDSSADSSDPKKALIICSFAGEDNEGGKEGIWYQIPKGFEKTVVGPQNGVVEELRNYGTPNETKTQGEEVLIRLRPYEVIVALQQ